MEERLCCIYTLNQVEFLTTVFPTDIAQIRQKIIKMGPAYLSVACEGPVGERFGKPPSYSLIEVNDVEETSTTHLKYSRQCIHILWPISRMWFSHMIITSKIQWKSFSFLLYRMRIDQAVDNEK